jgi:hypothetical protein
MKLRLPTALKAIHPVFHVSLLSPFRESTISNRRQPPPPPVEIEDELEWEVEQILDSRFRYRRLEYLVAWKGYEETEDRTTWEPASNLENSPELVAAFHAAYPDKPKPRARS